MAVLGKLCFKTGNNIFTNWFLSINYLFVDNVDVASVRDRVWFWHFGNIALGQLVRLIRNVESSELFVVFKTHHRSLLLEITNLGDVLLWQWRDEIFFVTPVVVFLDKVLQLGALGGRWWIMLCCVVLSTADLGWCAVIAEVFDWYWSVWEILVVCVLNLLNSRRDCTCFIWEEGVLFV